MSDKTNAINSEYFINSIKKPTKTATQKAEIIKLGKWISVQYNKFKNEEDIMKNKELYNKRTEFITSNEYKKYFK